MSQSNQQMSQSFRNAMANLAAAVHVITTDGPSGLCGITATAVCSVTDSPPTVMICINRNSEMNQVFQSNGKLCINTLNQQQQEIAKHFAGMTEATMDERFSWDVWSKGDILSQPMLKNALTSLEGEVADVQSIGTHDVYFVTIKNILLNQSGDGLVYFQRQFQSVMQQETSFSS